MRTTLLLFAFALGHFVSVMCIVPAQVLDLRNWYITLPVGEKGQPETVRQPALATFVFPPYFYVASVGGDNVVVFEAPANGTTTKDSTYPRSELREMNGTALASWSNKSGNHTMMVREAFTHLPDKKKEAVGAQIHNATDDVIEIRLSNSRLFVQANGNDLTPDLDPNYKLGSVYDLKIQAYDSKIFVSYNGVLKVTYAYTGEGWYFKAGCYTQTNLSHGDPPTSYGQTQIYSVEVSHTA
eukprot:TRINITY_DN10372_c0_g1_i5.p1 TRINITY_DN10372_c0_g1~~TRINITY_DN10372_c0_g1_i5.p1  ORF type:complete len:240 (+),score=38.11 TRINITY_DN10372_c0_g1_i5:104-823(+)